MWRSSIEYKKKKLEYNNERIDFSFSTIGIRWKKERKRIGKEKI